MQHLIKSEILALNSNLFYSKPFFMMDNQNVFLCPSPYILLYTMNWLFINLFLQYVQEINSHISREEIHSINKTIGTIIGSAYQKYIEKLLIHYKYTFYNLDMADTKKKILKDNTKPCADFIIETNKHYFIAELKNSLGFNKFHEDIRISLLTTWNRVAISLSQTTSTQNNLQNVGNKTVFHLVVVNEAVTVEPITFSLYNCRTNPNSPSLGDFSIISSAQFENLISSGLLDHFAETCKENSKILNNVDPSNPENIKILCVAQNLLFDPYSDIDSTFWGKQRCHLVKLKEEII